jgi:hypothetical protein
MLSEAYLVVLLYTVLSLMGKQEGDLEEDYQVGRCQGGERHRVAGAAPLLAV